ncbi:MAG: TolC family protein [Isosphaeraceae bacterium]
MTRAVRRTGLARMCAMLRLGTILGLRAILGFSALAWPGDLASAQSPASIPQASALPLPLGNARDDGSGLARPEARHASEPSAMKVPLHAGQTIQAIDLATALRLGGARDLDIATARQRVCESLAELERARALWLPSLFIGPTWYRADGQIQTITGQVETIDRSSLFIGATAALANAFPAAPPGTGFPPLTGLSATLRISDAIYEPLAARRLVAANRAGVRATTNDALLTVALNYFDLLQASGNLAIVREAAGNAQALTDLTGALARSGAGLEADHRRTLTELRSRRRAIQAAVGQLKVASARLIGQLVLDPHLVIAPLEPAEAIIRLIDDELPLDDLIAQGWRSRPELAQSQEFVQAATYRLKQARLRPFVPSLAFTFAGGGFGGGPGSFFGNFGSRGDTAASLFWDLRNLGFSDVAAVHRALAQRRTADIALHRAQAQVAADVVAAYELRAAAREGLDDARQAVTEAVRSLELNFKSIRRGAGLPGATRPLEVLQPIQALAQSRTDYLAAVLTYNRAQFQLYRALGFPPAAEALEASWPNAR